MKLVAAVALVLWAGCGGTPAEGEGDDGADAGLDAGTPSPTCEEATGHSDLAWIQTNVFSKRCATSGCHLTSTSSTGHLQLTSGQARASLVGQAAETAPGWTRVVAGDPSTSYLVVAIHGGEATGPEPAGGYMPLDQQPLCTEEREAIARWIAAGAPE